METKSNKMKEEQIKAEILSKLRATGRPGIENVIEYLNGSDFFRAGCHSHHHYTGGLAKHSLEACRFALDNRGNLPEDSVVIAALLHDLGTSHGPAARGIHGHGRRSVGILGRVCHFHLTDEEFEAIKLHMHGDAREMRTNPLARLVNRADHRSAGGHVRLDLADNTGHA